MSLVAVLAVLAGCGGGPLVLTAPAPEPTRYPVQVAAVSATGAGFASLVVPGSLEPAA